MFAFAPRTAAAQEPASFVIVVDDGAPPARARAWTQRVGDAVGAEPGDSAFWSAEVEPVDTVEPARLAAISAIEAHLVNAHRAAVRLEESDALRELARAESLAEQHLTIPGMAAWYAEVELAIALTAAQAELGGLADAALHRAASVDPSRTVRAAEARPELVERSRAAVRAAVTGPRGRFNLRADAEGARAFLDDRPLGALPREVEVPVGPHVLRIDAPGCRSWAQLVQVLEGDRSPVVVELAPTSARVEAARAETAARAGHPADVEEALGALRSLGPPALWMLWVGSGPEDCAVAVRCTAGGCEAPARLTPDTIASLSDAAGAMSPARLPPALAWLDARAPITAADEPWWERWYVWAAVGAILAAGAAAIGVLAQPRGAGPLQIQLDPTHLPTR